MAQSEIPKVGGDVDAYCSRCEMDLAHTVVAMVGDKPVQTKCNTCGAFHRYRVPMSERKASGGRRTAKKPSGASVPRTTSWERDWEQQVAQAGDAPIKKYRMTEAFSKADLMQHSKYGLGIVQQDLGGEKVSVLFRSGLRTLVVNRPVRAPSM